MKIETYITSGINLAHTVPCNILVSQNQLTKIAIKSVLKNRHGFTLAETLITLTIIGVIAAMTIPTLMTNYQKHVYVTGVQKAYSQLKNAMQMIPITENCSSGDYECAFPSNTTSGIFGDIDASITHIDILAKQYKITQKTTTYKDTNCKDFLKTDSSMACYYTDDGMIMGASHGYGQIIIDTNGGKGPNKMGLDRFVFMIASKTQNGIQQGTVMPFGSKQSTTYIGSSNIYWNYYPSSPACSSYTVKTKNWDANRCAGRVLEEGKMNY